MADYALGTAEKEWFQNISSKRDSKKWKPAKQSSEQEDSETFKPRRAKLLSRTKR